MERQGVRTARDPGGSTPPAPRVVEPLNPENPRAGRVVVAHQCFAAAGIQFQAYQRNTFAGNRPVGVKTCLRIVATVRKDQNEYGSPSEPDEHVSLEVAGDGLAGIATVLAGKRVRHAIHVARPGREVKDLSIKYQPEKPDAPFFISLSEGRRCYATSFGVYHAWSFRMVLAKTLQLLHPQHEMSFLLRSFTEMGCLLPEAGT